MKPGEFDELIRRKFEQNDFEYNPRSWERLSESLEGKPKRRTMLVWWALPVSGMAASVALAMGIASVVKYDVPGAGSPATQVAAAAPAVTVPAPERTLLIETAPAAGKHIAYHAAARATKTQKQQTALNNNDNANNGFNTRLQTVATGAPAVAATTKGNANTSVNRYEQKAEKHKPVQVNEWTFADATDENIRRSGLSVTLGGGINYGQRNNGFSAGASVRKMINKHVYVEGDIAFTNSDNIQHTSYTTWETPDPAPSATASRFAARTTGTTTDAEDAAAKKAVMPATPVRVTKENDALYSMQYAQFTPSIGYKVANKISIGVGPDFQQALADKRPALPTDNPENQQVAPLFDVGFVGKSEYALAKKVKAAVYYRKGINNIITPMNKFIERDYVQFQIKCTIFDK